MSQLEPWKRVYVKKQFLETVHGELGCITCHGGDDKSFNKKSAHQNLIIYPSEQAETYCADCHEDEVASFKSSLHWNQEGYFERFKVRAGGKDIRKTKHLLDEFNKDCGKCHTSCGQCHVVRPIAVNGGLNWRHIFKATPNLKNNCTACHGSRIGKEYTGENEGLKEDIHYTNLAGVMKCEDCHSAEEMHGSGEKLTSRYDVNNHAAPKCEKCHEDKKNVNLYHQTHWQKTENAPGLSCQVCHSQPYKNCNGCHVGKGITGESYMQFKIGRNYLKSARPEYDYIAVRHIPIVPDTYANWGEGSELTTFDAEPTWKYATPHNIRRWTAQTDTLITKGKLADKCFLACHNNEKYYLRMDSLKTFEKTANKPVVIP